MSFSASQVTEGNGREKQKVKFMKTQGILDYNIIEKLGESLYSDVFKVCPNDRPDQILVLKRIKSSTITGDFSTRLKAQTDYLKNLRIPGLIKPVFYSFEKEDPFLVRTYFDGLPLGIWRKSQAKIDLKDFFSIACSIVSIVKRMHNAGYFHGGIKPGNILIKLDTLDIRLIDPVRIINISEINRYIHDDGFRTETLPYISLEQTGRIRKNVNYATDIYSLGIVLYELLIGAPPFTSQDPLEIIYSHLAEVPVHPGRLRPDIPEMISNIIARMTLKEPEKRYQTGGGLTYDLIRCRNEYLKKGSISSFPLGLNDYSSRINIPSIMVGRDQEKEILLKEHELSCSGNFRSAMISGLPGIGKTRLIRELEIPIISERGYFTSGKFDQYQKNIPYSTLIQTLSNLTRIFLAEDSSRVEYWKKTIEKALGQNGRLVNM